MFITLILATLVALVWAVLSSLSDASGRLVPRDPTTLELAIMAVMTMATYVWATRYRTLRQTPVVTPDVAEIGFSAPGDDVAEEAAEHAA